MSGGSVIKHLQPKHRGNLQLAFLACSVFLGIVAPIAKSSPDLPSYFSTSLSSSLFGRLGFVLRVPPDFHQQPDSVTTSDFSGYPSSHFISSGSHHYSPSFKSYEHSESEDDGWQQGFPSVNFHDDHFKTHSHSYLGSLFSPGWGWGSKSQPEDTCSIVYNKNITSVADLEPGWVIYQIFRTKDERVQINPESILDPPLQPFPLPLTKHKQSEFETTYGQAIRLNLNDGTVNVMNVSDVDVVEDSPIAPTSNELQGFFTFYKLPTQTAPLRGKYDKNRKFERGLEASKEARRNNETSSPAQNFIESDLRFMGDLFKLLRKARFPEMSSQRPARSAPLDEEVSLTEVPQVIGRVERRFIPEPAHSERTVLDFEFNFGIPVVGHEFENPSEIMKDVRRRSARKVIPLNIPGRFRSSQHFRETVGDEIINSFSPQMRLGKDIFVATEKEIQEKYRINQYLICTDANQCDDCAIDPILSGNQHFDFGNSRPRRRRATPSNTNRTPQ